MSSSLNTLIQELQKEYDFLEGELNKCIKDWDFEGAQAFKKPLVHTKRLLHILKNLENPYFGRIEFLKSNINRIEETELSDDNSLSVSKYIKRIIPRFKSELKELEDKQTKGYIDNDIVQSTLEDLLAQRIKSFEIQLIERKILLLIEFNEQIITINIKPTHQSTSIHSILVQQTITRFQNLGFELMETEEVLRFSHTSLKDISNCMQMISLFVIDLLRYHGGKEAILKINSF